MNNKNISFVSLTILLILFIGGVTISYELIAKNVFIDVLNIRNDFLLGTIVTDEKFTAPENKHMNWQSRYPYDKEVGYVQRPIKKLQREHILFSEQLPLLKKIYGILDKYSKDYFVFTSTSKYISRQFSNLMGNRIILDAYGGNKFFLPNGHMTYERPYKKIDDELFNISSFNHWLIAKDIDFLYVVIPAPIGDIDDELNTRNRGYQVYSNTMANELIDGFKKNNITYIDTRDSVFKMGKESDDIFFRYEHHVTPKYGLRIAGIVSDYINKKYNIASDGRIFSEDSYKVTEAVKNEGVMNDTLFVYEGKENIEFYHPLYQVSIEKYIGDYDLWVSGSFDEVIYAMWDYPIYNTWNHGIKALKKYRNKQVVGGPKILLLTESYSDVISPFLACEYGCIDELDLRIFNGSLQKYVEEEKPDIVVMMYSAFDINSPGAEALFELQ